ncbi:MAG: right-handed parallel beta-helix repeat-containing protein, partial [Thermoguttaceae bacterium]|nr:right-handed parallel beta-helix repeat-containing protein [Thermoguttaceae bacterium]
ANQNSRVFNVSGGTASNPVAFVGLKITGGKTSDNGGGVYVSSGSATFTNSTISGNTSSYGGGVYVYSSSTATLYNTIVALNAATSPGNDVYDNGSSATVKAYNTLSSYTSWDSGSSNYTYNSSSPLFNDAANGDYTLAANSQAIDKGKNSYISGYSTDLAGKTRVVGGTVDLGAYEYQQATTQLSAPSLSVSATSSSELSVTIGNVSNASSYTLEYSTSSSFTSSTTATKTYSSSGTYPLAGLSANTKYYVRVKAIGDGTTYSNSAWSSAKNATTPNAETPSLVVTTNSDVVNDKDGLISLREAIQFADADSSLGSKITFASSLKGKTITLSGTQLEISEALTIDASALYTASTNTPGLTLDANQKSRVFYLTGGTEENPITLKGLTITGGETTGDGGGVCVYGGAATLTNCVISDNTASSSGGGVYVSGRGSKPKPTVPGVVPEPYGAATLTNCVISDNTATYGGGIHLMSSSTFTNCTVSGNTSSYGGGVYNSYPTTFTNCAVSGNTASSYGGGFYVSSYCDATLTNCVVSGNTATYGGGIYVINYGDATLTNCAINGNTASSRGGGVYVYSSGAATFTNSTISGNT